MESNKDFSLNPSLPLSDTSLLSEDVPLPTSDEEEDTIETSASQPRDGQSPVLHPEIAQAPKVEKKVGFMEPRDADDISSPHGKVWQDEMAKYGNDGWQEKMRDGAWQLDGTNDGSIVSHAGSSFQDRNGGFTMKDYEEQVSGLRKENFNLKLRIYFMEERLGMLHAPKDQENVYRVNIDLKVQGEELKKELDEKQELLAQAEAAFQKQELKFVAKLEKVEKQVEEEKKKRTEAEKFERLASEARDLLDVTREIKTKVSDESRVLYSEAFGSMSFAHRSEDCQMEQMDLLKQQQEMNTIIDEKNGLIDAVSHLEEIVASQKIGAADLEIKNQSILKELDTVKLELERALVNSRELEFSKNQAKIEAKETKEREEYLATKVDKQQFNINIINDELERKNEMIKNTEKIQQEKDEDINLLQKEMELKDNKRAEEDKRKIEDLEDELQNNKVQISMFSSQIVHYSDQISGLNSDLQNRNKEVLGFGNSLKRLRQIVSMQGHQDIEDGIETKDKNNINDEDMEIDVEEASQMLIEQVAKLVEENAIKDEKINKLEETTLSRNDVMKLTITLEEKNQEISNKNEDINELENNISEMQMYLNTKLGEISDMRLYIKESGNLMEKLKTTENNLMKATKAIQGFVDENHSKQEEIEKLHKQIKKKEKEIERSVHNSTNTSNNFKDSSNVSKLIKDQQDDILSLENERLQAENMKLVDEIEKEMENKEILLRTNQTLQDKVAEVDRLNEKVDLLTKENSQLSERLLYQNLRRKSLGGSETTDSQYILEKEASMLKHELKTCKSKYIKMGADLAMEKASAQLALYQRQYRNTKGIMKETLYNCELMRTRLEELADFLQQLLDDNVGENSLANLSIDMRKAVQQSIDQSRLLSQSVNLSLDQSRLYCETLDQSKLLSKSIDQSKFMSNSANHSIIEEEEEEEWVLSGIDVDSVEDDDTSRRCTEYHQILQELRDSLKEKREAEENLEQMGNKLTEMRQKFVSLEKNNEQDIRNGQVKSSGGGKLMQPQSRLPVGLGIKEKSLKSGQNWEGRGKAHPRRDTLTGIPKPFAVEEDDCWSEPDKDEARRRMGLGVPENVVVVGRTTDDEGEVVRGKEGLQQELRRERAKVARLGGEADRMRRELETSRQEVERLVERLAEAESIVRELNETKNEVKGKLRNVYDQLEMARGEFEERVKELEGEKEASRIEMKTLRNTIKISEEEHKKHTEEESKFCKKIGVLEEEQRSLLKELILWKEKCTKEEIDLEEEINKRNHLEKLLSQEQRNAEAAAGQFNQKISDMALGLANEEEKMDKLKNKLENESVRRIEMEQVIVQKEQRVEKLTIEFDKLQEQNKKISQENEEIATTLSSTRQKNRFNELEETNRKEMENQIEDLKKSKQMIENRCLDAERVLNNLTTENLENKENQQGYESGVFEDQNSPNSRPSSRRRELKSLDANIRKSNGVFASSSHKENGSKSSVCCDLRAELARVQAERDAALLKLGKTRIVLKDTADKLSLSNRRKNQVEKAICKQLTKTHDVLKKAKGNLENYSSEN